MPPLWRSATLVVLLYRPARALSNDLPASNGRPLSSMHYGLAKPLGPQAMTHDGRRVTTDEALAEATRLPWRDAVSVTKPPGATAGAATTHEALLFLSQHT